MSSGLRDLQFVGERRDLLYSRRQILGGPSLLTSRCCGLACRTARLFSHGCDLLCPELNLAHRRQNGIGARYDFGVGITHPGDFGFNYAEPFDRERDRPRHNRGFFIPTDRVKPVDISNLDHLGEQHGRP